MGHVCGACGEPATVESVDIYVQDDYRGSAPAYDSFRRHTTPILGTQRYGCLKHPVASLTYVGPPIFGEPLRHCAWCRKTIQPKQPVFHPPGESKTNLCTAECLRSYCDYDPDEAIDEDWTDWS